MTFHSRHNPPDRGFMNLATEFFRLEAAGGIVLVIAAVVALIVANTPLYGLYHYFLNEVLFHVGFSSLSGGEMQIKKSILLWINDGLMAVFFFLVGLEIKREFVEGELSSRERALLPFMAAVGGMVAPALIYYFFNQENPQALRGWAIPAATDIAFALGVLSLLGSRVPASLKALLLGIAVIDDIGAIVIIAAFFSHEINFSAVYVAGAALIGLYALNRSAVSAMAPYVIGTIILWIAVWQSGLHPTIAGVLGAMFIPLSCKRNAVYFPLHTFETRLHPWVAFAVLPIFGFANAGVPFDGMGMHSFTEPVTLGIALGLFAGKQIGVFGVMALTILLGLSPKPTGANWAQLYGVSLLCGIGFTMSLFIGGLAFTGVEMQASVRLGVLVGSILSAVLAYVLLRFASPVPKS